MAAGYVSIKGTEFQNWIESEFQHVSKHVPASESSSNNNEEHPNTTKTVPAEADQNKNVRSNLQKDIPQKLPKEVEEQLWVENKKLKNALCTLEETIKLKTCNCRNEIDEKRINQIFDEKVAKLELQRQKSHNFH